MTLFASLQKKFLHYAKEFHNLLIILIVITVEEVGANLAFECPCSYSFPPIIIGCILLLVPGFVFVMLRAIIFNKLLMRALHKTEDEKDLETELIEKTEKGLRRSSKRRLKDGTRSCCQGFLLKFADPFLKSILPLIVWTVMVFLNGKIYACFYGYPEPCIDHEGNKADAAISQVIGVIIAFVYTFLISVVQMLKHCCSNMTYTEYTYHDQCKDSDISAIDELVKETADSKSRKHVEERLLEIIGRASDHSDHVDGNQQSSPPTFQDCTQAATQTIVEIHSGEAKENYRPNRSDKKPYKKIKTERRFSKHHHAGRKLVKILKSKVYKNRSTDDHDHDNELLIQISERNHQPTNRDDQKLIEESEIQSKGAALYKSC